MIKRPLILISIVLIFLITLANQVRAQTPEPEIIQDNRTNPPKEESESPSVEEPVSSQEPPLEQSTEPPLEPLTELSTEPSSEPSTEPPNPDSKQPKKFICDSHEKADALKDLQRAFYDEKHIYLLSKHLAYRFKQFEIREKMHTRNYGDEDQLVITEPLVRSQDEEEGDYAKIYGYLYLHGSSRTDPTFPTKNYEVHMTKSEAFIGEIYKLKFDNETWGGRDLISRDSNYYLNKYLSKHASNPAPDKWFYTFYFYYPHIAFVEYQNNWDLDKASQTLNSRVVYTPSILPNSYYKMSQNLNQKFRFFVPIVEQWKKDGLDSYKSLFFIIDQSNKVHIQRNLYYLPGPLVSEELRLPHIPLDEFFSCHRDAISERELKGVWFDKKKKVFYLFINRFFKKIEADLFQDNFKLPKSSVFEPLKFDGSLFPEFEILSTKYIKTIDSKAYLVTSVGSVFAVTAENLADKLEPVNIGHVDKCPKQTLVIQSEVFCFGETEYYHLIGLEALEDSSKKVGEEKPHRISEIFQNTDIKYGKEQELKFIFNYHQNQFIFATQRNLFLFDYTKFSVNMETKQIVANYKAGESIEVKTNCLLDPLQPMCENIGLPTTINTNLPIKPTEPVTTATPYDFLRANMDILIIAFLVLLLVLIIIAFVFVRTLQSRKRPMVKYNLYVKGTSGLSRLGSSFASRIFKKKSGPGLPEAGSASASTKSLKGKSKAKSVTGDSASIVSNLTVDSRKSTKSVNYANPNARTSPTKHNYDTSELVKKKKPAYN